MLLLCRYWMFEVERGRKGHKPRLWLALFHCIKKLLPLQGFLFGLRVRMITVWLASYSYLVINVDVINDYLTMHAYREDVFLTIWNFLNTTNNCIALLSNYCIAQFIDGGNYWRIWHLTSDLSKFFLSIFSCSIANIGCLTCYPSIFSPSSFWMKPIHHYSPINKLRYTV